MDNQNESIVKNLIFSGGSIAGLLFYGAIKELHNQKVWDIENIEKTYSTSVGSVLSLSLSLKYSWDEIDNFIIKRPWQRVFKLDLTSIFNSVENVGIFNVQCFHECFDTLLLGKGLETNITMKELYEFTNIENHFICTDFNNMSIVDVCYKTYPDFPVIDAIYGSCCLPILFKPILYKNMQLCDGGLTCNFPIELGLKESLPEETIVIGLDSKYAKYDEKDNLFSYLFTLSLNVLKSINIQNKYDNLKSQVYFDPNVINLDNSIQSVHDSDRRKELIEQGVNKVKELNDCTPTEG